MTTVLFWVISKVLCHPPYYHTTALAISAVQWWWSLTNIILQVKWLVSLAKSNAGISSHLYLVWMMTSQSFRYALSVSYNILSPFVVDCQPINEIISVSRNIAVNTLLLICLLYDQGWSYGMHSFIIKLCSDISRDICSDDLLVKIRFQRLCVCMWVSVCVRLCMYACMRVCAYVYVCSLYRLPVAVCQHTLQLPADDENWVKDYLCASQKSHSSIIHVYNW